MVGESVFIVFCNANDYVGMPDGPYSVVEAVFSTYEEAYKYSKRIGPLRYAVFELSKSRGVMKGDIVDRRTLRRSSYPVILKKEDGSFWRRR